MAQKKITDLQLKASVLGTESIPVDDTIQSYRVTGSQIFDYVRGRILPEHFELSNLTIVPSVSSNALTIAIKTKAGTDPTSTDLIRLGFRSATLTSGSYNIRSITAALSMVVSSGSTLGQTSGQPSRIWIYLIDNGGVVELAVSHKKFTEDALVSTTAEGGAGAADSATAIYSTTARTNVPIRLIGYIDNTQTTAGTWTSAGTQVQLIPFLKPNIPTIQKFTSGSGTYYVPAGCTGIRVVMVGGGGGGSGSGSSGATNGSAGNASTFGTSLLSAGGGAGGVVNSSNGGAGGTSSLGTGPVGIALPGGMGGAPGTGTVSTSPSGGMGGSSAFGGAGSNSGSTNPATAGSGGTNTGGGGGGGGSTVTTAFSGCGGGAGGYVNALINQSMACWATSFSYSVGSGGSNGAGGTVGLNGGSGGSGIIIVEEFY